MSRPAQKINLRIREWAREWAGGPKLYDVIDPRFRGEQSIIAQLPRRGNAETFIRIYGEEGPEPARRYMLHVWRKRTRFQKRFPIKRPIGAGYPQRDPGKPDSRRKIHQRPQHESHIRELRPRSASPRGIERPIGAGYFLAVYPYPFGDRLVAWHVYHARNPNEWYAAGEADSFDDALDAADRKFGVNLRASSRDPRKASRPIRPTPRQRAFIAEKIPVLIREGYPQRQAIAIAFHMARVPPQRAR